VRDGTVAPHAAADASAAPQSSQNADVGAFSEPHFGQRAANELPHAEQNLLPVVLSVPHFEHFIGLPSLEAGMSSITRRHEQTEAEPRRRGGPIRVAGPEPTQVANRKQTHITT